MLRGIHYRNQWFYYLQNLLKLGPEYDRRFKIAAQYIKPGESVLDICAGPGELRQYLPAGCSYRCIEASSEFIQVLRNKNVPVIKRDLYQELKPEELKADVAVMVVSFCHFQHTSGGDLLETLKKTAGRVVIVEDVLAKLRGVHSFRQKMMNYCCETEYYRPFELFTADEFQNFMQRHGYTCVRANERYLVGIYG